MRDAFIRALTTLAEQDDRVVLVTGDLGFGVLTKFAERFPNQYVNAGVAEQNMTAIATGMALAGWKAYTYSIANFTTLRCLEQIRNDACYHNADVTVVSVGGGFSYGQLGMSHFATEDIAIMRALPGLEVVVPSETWETETLTREMAARRGPKYLRLDKSAGGTLEADAPAAPFGKARQVRDGTDATIMTTGGILAEATDAADRLKAHDISCRILSFSTLKPFDTQAVVQAAGETRGIVTVEEHVQTGGLGSAVADGLLAAAAYPGFFYKIGMQDEFPTIVGDQLFLRKQYGLDATAIVAAVLKGLGLNS